MKTVKSRIREGFNKDADSESYNRNYRSNEVITGILENPEIAFHRTTWKVIREFLPNVTGKKICVPSSGDNHAVFALAALGAKVTSCDISDRQLAHANRIAKKYSLDIDFILQDTMELSDIESSSYDFVYTSEGVHVWVDDLNAMYNNIHRILKKGGIYINYEIHPFCRPFKDGKGEIVITKPYDSTGPHNEGLNYHWRMQDIVNAIASSGLSIIHLEEMFDEKDKGHFWFYKDKRAELTDKEIEEYYDWKTNPLAALPQWFSICAIK